MNRNRSPGVKLFFAGLVAAVLIVPLMMVYALVYDRENQSQTAQANITAGWGGAQTVAGPVLVIPYTATTTQTETVDGRQIARTSQVRRELFVSPQKQNVKTTIAPDRKSYAIYESVVYDSAFEGSAQFTVPDDLSRYGVNRASLMLDEAQLRFGVSDPRGLTDNVSVVVNGVRAELEPGNGPAATDGLGFSADVAWSGQGSLDVRWNYGVRGSRSISLLPRGGETEWSVSSAWPHPGFSGDFLPNTREVSAEGFTATYSGINNLALNRQIVSTQDQGAPPATASADDPDWAREAQRAGREGNADSSAIATIGLVEPVDLYSQVDRAVKYGFLFIGFTFAAFLMFDIVGGARVAPAEYLLTGAGLVLFFVMLLAFAEVVGFALAYAIAAAAIIGLLTAYSAAILRSWRRASFIGAMLAGLYALLFVLLSMETFSLLIGSLLLFFALAGVMYVTRHVDWSSVGQDSEEPVIA